MAGETSFPVEIAGWDMTTGASASFEITEQDIAAAADRIANDPTGLAALSGEPAPGGAKTHAATPKPRITRSASKVAVPARYRPSSPAQGSTQRDRTTRGPAEDPLDPKHGKWAVVVLESDAKAAEEALSPLVARRVEQGVAFTGHASRGGKPGWIVIPRPDSRNPATWERYIKDASVVPMPHYLLFVGGPDRFPFEVVAALDGQRCTGRLDLGDSPLGPLSWDACRVYAEKVVAFEEGKVPVAPRALLYSYGTDRATRQSHDDLAVPLRKMLESGELVAPGVVWSKPDVLFGADATVANLIDKLKSQKPALVFTASHGLERAEKGLWGALTDVGHRSNADPVLSAASLPQGAFAPGAVMFCFACFSGGVPEKSAIAFLKSKTEEILSPESFVPALPRALLARPDGPIAFVGHVDRATSFSFQWDSGPAAFRDFCEWSVGGYGTLGQAMRTLREAAADSSIKLTEALSPVPGGRQGTPQDIFRHWIHYHDLIRYILLGDPAIRVRDGLSKDTV